MCAMSVSEWLAHLENRLPKEIDLRLENVREIAIQMDLLQLDAPIILVAGTNGKGSTVASLEAIYLAAGYKVGAYTSPHLLSFNERIVVNQQIISDDDLCTAFNLIENHRKNTNLDLTYFETTTLAALWYFKRAKLDVIILEVGMGGRLDATNIIDADLSIVTTIDFDHQDYLGNSLEEIGYEKAGIFRTNKPCLYADCNPPQSVLTHAKALNAQLECLKNDYEIIELENSFILNYYNQKITLPKPALDLKAAASAVVASLRLMNILPITENDLIVAMQKVKICGRQQIVRDPIMTIYDVAHNPQAVKKLANFVASLNLTTTVRAVFSAFNDKNLKELIRPLCGLVNEWYPAVMCHKRAASEKLLSQAFHAEMNKFSRCFSDPIAAYRAALNESKNNDVIIVYGSFIMVGTIMSSQHSQHSQQKGYVYEIGN